MQHTTSGRFKVNDPRTINAWALFDWANSAFVLAITVAIFPAYFVKVTPDLVELFGLRIENSSLYAFSISGAYLVIAIASPFLSGIADYGGKRKVFLKFFTTFGAIGCLALFFFDEGSHVLMGLIPFIVGMIGFAGGLVFYNAYLPLIVSEDHYDEVSARGFAFGYVGSVILLVASLVLILNPTWFGIAEGSTLAVRISFVMVGLWWLLFAGISLHYLPNDDRERPSGNLVLKGFEELRGVWRIVKGEGNIKAFLLSFFFYSAGVQTVIYTASVFGEKELQFGTAELIGLILLLQLVAIAGAYFFAKVSERRGNKLALMVMLVIWTGICFAGYFTTDHYAFYGIAVAVGLVMGGIQALSRSTYSKLLPAGTEDTTSFFSFYDVLEKAAIILGTFSFGLIEQVTGSMRLSFLFLGLFFVVSIGVLARVRIARADAR